MSHSAASDLGLHCLPITFLGVSRLQWAKICFHGEIRKFQYFSAEKVPYLGLCYDKSITQIFFVDLWHSNVNRNLQTILQLPVI